MKATAHFDKTAAHHPSLVEPLEQRIAPAGVFRWNTNGSGDWNSPANWFLVFGDAGAGYPSAPSDEALLTNVITANTTVTIPDGVEIVIGKIRFDDNNSYTIAANGSGRLVLSHAFDDPSISATNANGNAAHQILAPVVLHDNATFSNSSTQALTIQSAISDDGFFRGITKTGAGTIVFGGSTPNAYTGTTSVLEGSLVLAKTDGVPAISNSNLFIGDPAGIATGRVALGTDNQMPSEVTPIIHSTGVLDLANHDETISSLTIVGGGEVKTGTGVLTLDSILVGAFQGISTATISGTLNLTGLARIFVTNSAGPAELNVSAVITGQDGLNKIGDGTLRLSVTGSQEYTGRTTVDDGLLILASTSFDAGISNDILIAEKGTLRVTNDFEIRDTSTVTVCGKLEFAANDDFKNLVLEGGTVSIADGMIFTVRNDGSVTVPQSQDFAGGLIEGPGSFRMLVGDVTFNIGQSASDADLTINAPIAVSTVGMIKTGIGKLVLNEDGTFTGGIDLQAGELYLNSKQNSVLNLTGGQLTTSPFTDGFSLGGITGNGGRIQPDADLPVIGNVAFSAGLVFAPTYTGSAKGLEVEGNVDLGGATLDLVAFSLPSSAQPITVLTRSGAGNLVGMFDGLPQGATLTTPNGNYTISYTNNAITLTPVLIEPVIAANGKSATFMDLDGDLVIARVTKGTLTASNFTLLATGAGAQLVELSLDETFAGSNLKLSAMKKGGAGNGRVDVVNLEANVDLGTITIPGDVGTFVLGSTATPAPAFASFSVQSLGYSRQSAFDSSFFVSQVKGSFGTMKVKGNVLGTVAGFNSDGNSGAITIGGSLLPGPESNRISFNFTGNLGKFTVGRDYIGGSDFSGINITGNVGQFTIGGSLVGGAENSNAATVVIGGNAGAISIGRELTGVDAAGSGSLEIGGNVGTVKIGKSVVGNSFDGTGRLAIGGDVKSITIGGDLRGGAGLDSGAIAVGGAVKQLKIGGSVFGGANGSGVIANTLGAVSIARDLIGTPFGRAVISAEGASNPADANAALAIASLTVSGSVSEADILAGYDGTALSPINSAVQIGKIAVKGDWTASRALAGIDSVDGLYGNSDDQALSPGGSVTSRIASIVVGGTVRGTIATGDSYGFVADSIGSLSFAGKKVALSPTQNDAVAFGVYADVYVREV